MVIKMALATHSIRLCIPISNPPTNLYAGLDIKQKNGLDCFQECITQRWQVFKFINSATGGYDDYLIRKTPSPLDNSQYEIRHSSIVFNFFNSFCCSTDPFKQQLEDHINESTSNRNPTEMTRLLPKNSLHNSALYTQSDIVATTDTHQSAISKIISVMSVNEIWPHVTGESPLIIFDFDETLIKLTDVPDITTAVEKEIMLKLQNAKSLYPSAKFIILTNGLLNWVTRAHERGVINMDFFDSVITREDDDMDKSSRLNSYIDCCEKLPDQILFIDDRKLHLDEIKLVCNEKKINFLAVHYLGAITSKHKRFLDETNKQNHSSLSLSQFYQYSDEAYKEELLLFHSKSGHFNR